MGFTYDGVTFLKGMKSAEEKKQDLKCVVELLKLKAHRLGNKDRMFAQGIVKTYEKLGWLSKSHEYWLGVLAQKALHENLDDAANPVIAVLESSETETVTVLKALKNRKPKSRVLF